MFYWLERLSNDCRKTNTKGITPTNQRSRVLIKIPSNHLQLTLLKGREKSRAQGAIGFGFACHWREVFQPITKRRNRNRVPVSSI